MAVTVHTCVRDQWEGLVRLRCTSWTVGLSISNNAEFLGLAGAAICCPHWAVECFVGWKAWPHLRQAWEWCSCMTRRLLKVFSPVSHSRAALQGTREVSLWKLSVKFWLPRWDQAAMQEQTDARLWDVMFLPNSWREKRRYDYSKRSRSTWMTIAQT